MSKRFCKVGKTGHVCFIKCRYLGSTFREMHFIETLLSLHAAFTHVSVLMIVRYE